MRIVAFVPRAVHGHEEETRRCRGGRTQPSTDRDVGGAGLPGKEALDADVLGLAGEVVIPADVRPQPRPRPEPDDLGIESAKPRREREPERVGPGAGYGRALSPDRKLLLAPVARRVPAEGREDPTERRGSTGERKRLSPEVPTQRSPHGFLPPGDTPGGF